MSVRLTLFQLTYAWSLVLYGLGSPSNPPSPGPAQYDEEQGKVFAALAQAAYASVDMLQSWSCGSCKQSGLVVKPNNVRVVQKSRWFHPSSNSTHIYVARGQWPSGEDGCVVSARGSITIENWIDDLASGIQLPIEFPGCKGCWVGQGWLFTWTDARKDVMKSLIDLGCRSETHARIWVTGHSLGAAVSTLAMFDLRTQGYDVHGMNFESPRVGNPTFASEFGKLMEKSIFRVTRGTDPVPHFPILDTWFQHTAPEVFYDDNGTHVVCLETEKHGVESKCADRYDWTQTIAPAQDFATQKYEHCGNDERKYPLVPNGNMCTADYAASASSVTLV